MSNILRALLAGGVVAFAWSAHAADENSLGADITKGAKQWIKDASGKVKEIQLRETRVKDIGKVLSVRSDRAMLDELYRMASAGNPSALNLMGWLFDHGKGGVVQDSYKAATYFRAAAIKGDADALYNLSIILDDGRGLKADKGMAARLLKQAITANQKYAATRAGILAEQSRDYEGALRSYAIAASDRRQVYAIYRMGLLTFRGATARSKPDAKNGLMLLTRAASLWSPEAMGALAGIYADGLMVPVNRVEAGKWLELWRLNPLRNAEERAGRDPVALNLTKEERGYVQRAVDVWKGYRNAPEPNARVDYTQTLF